MMVPLSSCSSWITLYHELPFLVGSVLFFPCVALVAELVHFAGIDGSVLLTTGEGNDSQAEETQWGDSSFELAGVQFARNGGDEFKGERLVCGLDLVDHGKLTCCGGVEGVCVSCLNGSQT